MNIRRVAPEDWTTLKALLLARGLPALHSGISSSSVLVGIEGGRVVGVAALEVAARDGFSLWLAVEEGLEGKGRGTSLLRALFARAQELGLRRLYLVGPKLSTPFAAMGFTAISAEEVPREVRLVRGYPDNLAQSGGTVLRLQIETRV